MKTIEIATAHNIVVTHEIANVAHRMAAFAIDGAIIGVYSIMVGIAFVDMEAVIYIGIGLVMVFYHLGWEVFNKGQTPGKQVTRLRVVSIQGITPSLQDYLLRWVFRLVDITFSLGSVAILSMATSPRGQRIGDLLARTTVINLRSSRQVDLQSLQKIGKLNEQILYPGVVRYSDTDMLLIKQTLQRYQRENNEATTQIILDLMNRICADLDISPGNIHPSDFLKKVLSDYIVLTR